LILFTTKARAATAASEEGAKVRRRKFFLRYFVSPTFEANTADTVHKACDGWAALSKLCFIVVMSRFLEIYGVLQGHFVSGLL